MEGEVAKVVVGQCRTIHLLLHCYEERKEPDTLDSLIYHLDRFYHNLVRLDITDRTLESVGISLSLIQEIYQLQTVNSEFTPSVLRSGSRGRPKFEITQQQLEYLLNFSCREVSDNLGVSLRTIRRRMTEYGLSVSSLYSNLSDGDLDVLVSQILHEYPNCGYRLMHGHLLCCGHRITQARVRNSMHRVDPEGLVIRWASTVQRRKYKVHAPLSLWHIDGNHKLIR